MRDACEEIKKLLRGMNRDDALRMLHQCIMDIVEEQSQCEGRIDWLTTKQASERLGITTAGIRKWLLNGKLKGRMVGNRWRINKASVEAME